MQIFLDLVACLLLAAGLFAQEPEDRLRKGVALMNLMRPLEAEEAFKSIDAKDPHYPSARTFLGYLFFRRAALTEAQQAFSQALASRPESAPARYGLAITLAQKGLLQSAARELQEILDDPAVGAKARAQWIQNLFFRGKDEEAFREAREQSERFPSAPDFHSLLGLFWQVRGKPREALLAYRRALELQPSHLSSYFSVISIYREQKDWNNALLLLEKALQLDENHPLLYEELAFIYKQLGKNKEAETAHQKAQHAFDAEILHIRATTARIAGRSGEAEKLLRECVFTNPRMSKAWTDLADMQRRSNRLEEARRNFMQAIEVDSSNRPARLGLTATLQAQVEAGEASDLHRQIPIPDDLPGINESASEQKDSDWNRQAAAALLRAVRDYPDNPDLLSYLGYMHESLGRNRESMEAYAEALEINPLQLEALLGKARHFLREGNTQQAVDAFRSMAAMEPSNTRAWLGLIQALRLANDLPGAESACRDCLRHNSSDFDCREMLAHLRLEASDYLEAAEQYQIVLRNGCSSKDILDGLAFSLMKLGDGPQAIGLFESSLRRYGQDAWIYSNLGYLHQCRGELQAAIVNYRRARRLSPSDPIVNHSLGFALYLARDFAAAVEPFQAALRSRPDWGLAHFNLAMTYWNLRQYAMALTHARLAEEKGVPEARRIAQALSANPAPGVPRIVAVYRRKQ